LGRGTRYRKTALFTAPRREDKVKRKSRPFQDPREEGQVKKK
jgi:hypothetical protein